jgi:hypothetical protein
MVKRQWCYLHDASDKVTVNGVAVGCAPVGGESLLCFLLFISVVEDKLPKEVITVKIELDEFKRRVAWLGTDYFPIGLEAPRKVWSVVPKHFACANLCFV